MSREPFLGPNAKAFAIQFVFVLVCLFVIVPLLAPSLRPYSDRMVERGFDALCTIGLCTPEASERRLASEHRQ